MKSHRIGSALASACVVVTLAAAAPAPKAEPTVALDVTRRGDAEYPPEAIAKGVHGTVIVRARVDAAGDVLEARIEHSIPLLDRAAMLAVMQWRFAPDAKRARPVWTLVPVRFALDGDGSNSTPIDTTRWGRISRERLRDIPVVPAPPLFVHPTWPPPDRIEGARTLVPAEPGEQVWKVEPSVKRNEAGRVNHETFRGRDGRARGVALYVAAALAAKPDSNAALLIVFDGSQYESEIPLPHLLDSLVAAHAIPPCVAVLLDDGGAGERLADLANRSAFSDLLTNELLPWVHARVACSRDPRRVVLVGSSAGGVGAMHAALRHPEAFGNVLSQSGAFWRGAEGSNDAPYEWLTGAWRDAPTRDVCVVLEVGSTESRGALGGAAPSILEANRHLHAALLAKGVRVTYAEVPNGHHAPDSWGPRLPGALVALFALRGR